MPARRAVACRLLMLPLLPLLPRSARANDTARTVDPAWVAAARAQLERARAWGDQPYGAVLVLDGRIVGEGPSRVVLHGDDNAHAEREAIRDAQRRLGRTRLDGSLLVSTSRPCAACEAAAAAAGVARMLHGTGPTDAGAPRR